jgi:hypothetical protein
MELVMRRKDPEYVKTDFKGKDNTLELDARAISLEVSTAVILKEGARQALTIGLL